MEARVRLFLKSGHVRCVTFSPWPFFLELRSRSSWGVCKLFFVFFLCLVVWSVVCLSVVGGCLLPSVCLWGWLWVGVSCLCLVVCVVSPLFLTFSTCLHICLYICQSVSIYIHVCLFIYLTIFHPTTQSLYHSIYLSLHPSIYLYISSLKPLQVKENPHFYKNPDVGVYSSKTPSQYSYTALSASECKEGGREEGGDKTSVHPKEDKIRTKSVLE